VPGYAQILQLLHQHTGVDFSLYKSATVHRRILRRMVLNRQDTPAHYAGFLRRNARELDALYADALVNVTSFFRNPEAYEVLRRRVFPALLKQQSNDPLRVWVPGCSTGQEAYSIAMVFAELTEKAARPRMLQVFATDLNAANLEKARHGLYARTMVRDVPPARLRRFFVEEDAGYRIVKPLRERVVFARQNLISDRPFSRMDLISCRNLLICLEPEVQNKALLNFHYALNPGGVLFLGAAEAIGGLTDLFAPVDKKRNIFSRQPAPSDGTPHSDDTSATFVRCTELEGELAETRDCLQSVLEHQASANEELEAANEELTRVNEEVVHRNTKLNRLNPDLHNLQMSTRLGLVLLGGDLSIRRFSPQAERKFNLRASDVGRPLRSVRHTLQCPDLEALIAGVIAQGRETEREVQDHDGHWFSLRVCPYVTLDQKVDGAVLVLVDIDDLKRKERLIREEHEHAEAIIHTVPSALVILSDDLGVQSANETFYHTFKLSAADTTGHSIFELDHGSWDIPRLRHLLEDIIPRNSVFNDFEFTHDFARIGRRSLLLNARLLNNPGGRPKEILLGIHDITERRQARNALDAAQAQLANRAKQLEHAVTARTSELTAANAELKRAMRGSRDVQEKLRQLTHQFISEQEEQRRSISRELHYEVVQTLIGINVELAALRHDSSGDRRTLRARIARTQRLVENSVNTVHRFARELRPAMLDDLGLIPALHTYCKSLTERKKLRIHLTAFAGVEALGNAERTALYRVAQEALANVDRHARATLAKVSVTEIPGAVRMEISDNGRAFDVARTLGQKNPKRLGLVGMTERIEMVGGTLTVVSQRGTGTTVRAEIPFKRQDPEP
jgi:PAS domain S-box-containing protein